MCQTAKWSIATLICTLITIGQVNGAIRYKELSYSTVVTREDIHYRTAIDCNSAPDSLYMDFFEPKDDTASVRPAIMVLYGGSFVTGSRKDTLVTAFSNYFARCGYAVFAIDYRIGVNKASILPKMEIPMALYRAIQDSRAAIRFIRKNADSFKVDTTKLFALGYSAGAVTLLHHAYVDTAEAAQNLIFSLAAKKLGVLDDADNLQYSSKINCVVNCCGAIADTTWVKSGDASIISFHGTKDQIVPYGVGFMNNDTSTTKLYGSSVVHQKAEKENIINKLVSFEGADHYLIGEPRTTIPPITAEFLFKLMNPTSIKINKSIAYNRASLENVPNRYFDVAGRILQSQRCLTSSFIVKWNRSDTKKYLNMKSRMSNH